MQVTQSNLSSFSGFQTTDELINQSQGGNIEMVDQNNPQGVIQLTTDKPTYETDDLLARVMGEGTSKKEEDQEEGVEGDNQNSETPAEEATAPLEKGKQSKLPQDFSEIVSALEEKGILQGFDDGKYETIDDIVDLLQENNKIKMEDFKKEAEEALFSSFTPAMQTVLQYAQMGVQNPQELIPLLTAIDNLEYSATLDANNEEHYEQIIRLALSTQGLEDRDIDEELSDLRERGTERIAQRAKALKPVLDKYNRQRLEATYAQKEEQRRKEDARIADIQKRAKEAILDAPTVGGMKLSRQEREQAFLAVSQPDPRYNGLQIYALIDSLMQKGDFETLTEIWIRGTDKKSYMNKIGATIKDEMAKSTQRALRLNTGAAGTTVDTKRANRLTRPVKSTFTLG